MFSFYATHNAASLPRAKALRLTPQSSVALATSLLLSFCTYFTDSNKLAFYAAALAALLLATIATGVSFAGAKKLSILIILYACFAAASVSANLASIVSIPLEALLYPIIAVMITGSLWKVFFVNRPAALMILTVFLVNAAIATLPIFGVQFVPIIGEIEIGRYIFLTDIPSSAGLLWNVNYYAVAQGTGFWYCMVQLARGALPSSYRWLVYIIGASVVLGSSRSATLALGFTLLIFWSAIYTGRTARAMLMLSAAVLGLIFLDDLFLQIYLNDALNEGLRLYRGLNSRDELWAAGLEAATRAPFLGYGDTELVKDELRSLGAPTTTVQNAFLTVQLLYGMGAASVFVVLALTAISTLVTHTFDRASAAVYALFVFIFLDAFVRSYVPGGIGLMPFMFLASCAFLLRLSRAE